MAPETPSLRVLVVDDEPCMRKLLATRMKVLGVQADPYASAKAALDGLDAGAPDLIVSDVVMPGMDGLEFCRRVKGDPATRKAVFVVCSALGRDVRERSLEAGADDFIPKNAQDAAFFIRMRLMLRLASGDAGAGPAEARILLVSADPFVRGQFAGHLAAEPWHKKWVPGLGHLGDALQTWRPNLLVLDLGLPGLDPDGAIQRLRELPRGSLPVLVLVSRDQMPLLESLGPCIQDYLPKPLNAAETRHRLRLLLRLPADLQD